MLDPLSQTWQKGSALAVYTLGRALVSKLRLSGLLYRVNTEFVNDAVWYAQQLMNEQNRNFLHPNAN